MIDSKGRKAVLFRLKRFWEGQVGSMYIEGLDLYEEIKAGRKTSEWRDLTDRWRSILHSTPKPTRAWFVCGYPKGNMPRLEADIVGIVCHLESDQYEIKIANVEEILA